MKVIGLTGSIAMGKSTTASLFAEQGAWVHDSDEAVRRLYARGGGAARKIEARAPQAIRGGAVDKAALKEAIAADPTLLSEIEAIVHPLVRDDRRQFIDRARKAGAALVILDVPLLFETGADGEVDATIVATAPYEVQRERVLARPGMDAAAFERLLQRQMPDQDKRARADYVVDTSRGMDDARAQVLAIIDQLTSE